MKKVTYAILAVFLTTNIAACATGTGEEKKDDSTKGKTSVKASGESGSINLTKEEFLAKVYNYEKNTDKWVYEGDKPAIVDFYADWCQPCKVASPILDELAEEYEDEIYVYKIDTQKEKELAAAFGIRSIPTFMLIPMGEMPQVFSGIGQTKEATKEIFVKAIDEVLLKNKK